MNNKASDEDMIGVKLFKKVGKLIVFDMWKLM